MQCNAMQCNVMQCYAGYTWQPKINLKGILMVPIWAAGLSSTVSLNLCCNVVQTNMLSVHSITFCIFYAIKRLKVFTAISSTYTWVYIDEKHDLVFRSSRSSITSSDHFFSNIDILKQIDHKITEWKTIFKKWSIVSPHLSWHQLISDMLYILHQLYCRHVHQIHRNW